MWTFPAERVLNRRGLPDPDGRPLYAYRVTEEELEELRLLFRMEWGGPRGVFERAQERAFCLFAAEWWRRNHDHGPWAWHGILEAVGWSGISMQRLYRVVSAGLKYWKRPLLRLAAGDRAYLVTLACEGGLPLKLLLRDGAALRNYFKALLEEFHYLRPAGVDGMEIAQRVAHKLPLSLRQPPVYRLGGELAEKILDLQAEVPNTTDPVAELDKRHPKWREELPLRVEDETARALLNNLVLEASRIRTRPRGAGIRVRRLLQRTGEHWSPSAEVALPSRMTLEELDGLLCGTAKRLSGRRFEVALASAQRGLKTLALLSPRAGGAHEDFLVERASRFATQLLGAEALEELRIAVTFGTETLGPFDIPGGPRGSELPWVYAQVSDSAGELDRIGMGTVRSRQGVLWVAVPEDWTLHPIPGGEVEAAGRVPGAERSLWRVLGRCEIERTDRERFRVSCGEKVEHSVDYVLAGPRIPELAARSPLFHGPPRLIALAEDGTTRSVPPQALEWRRLGWPSWQDMSPECLGDVLLRYRMEGAVEWLGRAAVLPEGFKFKLEPSRDPHAGEIRLEGLPGALVEPEPQSGVQSAHRASPGEGKHYLEFRCLGEPPSSVTMKITWAQGRSVAVGFPYPVRLARFQTLQGRVLAIEEEVAASRLGEVEAAAVTTNASERFHLEGILQTGSLAAERRGGLDLLAPLSPAGEQLRRLPLATIQRAVIRILAVASDPKASVRMRIAAEGAGALSPHPVMVFRHDLGFSWADGSDQLRIHHPSGLEPEPKALESIRVTARPLDDPMADEVELPKLDGVTTWSLERLRASGRGWLLAGWDGGWCRVAPAVLTGGEVPVAGSAPSLAAAVANEDPGGLEKLYCEMSETPNHFGWDEFLRYLEALRGYPAASLRHLRALSKLPEALAMACLVAREEHLPALRELLEDLPVSVHLMPADAWARAAQRHAAALREVYSEDVAAAAGELRKDVSRFLGDLERVLPAAAVLREWMLHQAGARLEETPQLAMAANPTWKPLLQRQLTDERTDAIARGGDRTWMRSSVLDQLGLRLQSNRPEIRQWLYHDPNGLTHRESLLNAPWVAAATCAWGLPTSTGILLEVMSMRDLDPDYFDRTHSLALAVLLAGRLGEELTEGQ